MGSHAVGVKTGSVIGRRSIEGSSGMVNGCNVMEGAVNRLLKAHLRPAQLVCDCSVLRKVA
jgi:hypothetical protein